MDREVDGGKTDEPAGDEDRGRARFADNPFYVLGLRPNCTRAELEREGQKLLAMLELGMSRADSYATPVGERARTADKVRRAMAELRDPERRLGHELWARLPPERSIATAGSDDTAAAGDDGSGGRDAQKGTGDHTARDARDARRRPWAEARVALGWGRK